MYGEPVFGTVKDTHPMAETTHGRVMGENRDGIAIFRGIPYGDDCGGKRRFLPPVPAKNWEGIKDCTENGPICIQYRGSIQGWDDQGPAFNGGKKELFKVDNEIKGEDCLVANVLTPGIDDKKRPVLFYIHGGGYAVGTGALVLGADKVCREQDIVLVSINHRLGPFGYLYLGGFDKRYEHSGVAGLLDLVLGLQWAKENVANFGGDPDKITIVGESGGGSKVTAMMATDVTEGLFRGAVVESGSGGNMNFTREEGHAIACKCLDRLGIPYDEWERILEVPAEKILDLMNIFDHEARSFRPVSDGVIFKDRSEGRYYMADWAASVNVIVGWCDEETAVWAGPEDFNVTDENIRERLITPAMEGIDAEPMALCSEKNVDRVIMETRKLAKRSEDANHLYLKVKAASRGQNALNMLSTYQDKGCKDLYHYMVTWDSHHPLYPQYKFAWHTATLPLHMRVVWQPEDEQLSQDFCQAISAFVRTGCPATRKFKWQKFTTENKETMVIDGTYCMENDPEGKLRAALADR